MIFTAGYIIGIIWGLYFKINVVFFCAFFIPVCIFLQKKFNISKQLLVIIIVSFSVSNLYVSFKNDKYNKTYEMLEGKEITINTVVVSDAKENKYNYSYKIKVNNIYLNLSIKKTEEKPLEYGDFIKVRGIFNVPNTRRNYKGFNYREYLKTRNIYGIIETSVEQIEILDKNKANMLFALSNRIKNKIIEKQNETLPKESAALINGILIGYKEDMDDGVIDSFKNSSLSHILAVSRVTRCVYYTNIKKSI